MIQTRDCEKPSEHDCGDSGEAGVGVGGRIQETSRKQNGGDSVWEIWV